jgi:hypothetical protein
MKPRRYFLLTEAAAMLPLVRQILVDVREARARAAHLQHELARTDLGEADRAALAEQQRHWRDQLRGCLDEADRLGVEITAGIRCHALFPFEHQWIGPHGDGKIRSAFFLYNDAQPSITHWYFAGWPHDLRKVWPHWWKQHRNGARVTAD